MPGLVPGIHVLKMRVDSKTWMAGTSPAMTMGLATGTSCELPIRPARMRKKSAVVVSSCEELRPDRHSVAAFEHRQRDGGNVKHRPHHVQRRTGKGGHADRSLAQGRCGEKDVV